MDVDMDKDMDKNPTTFWFWQILWGCLKEPTDQATCWDIW